MGGVLSILLVGCRSRRDKFKADVAGKKLNRKCPTRGRRHKLRCREPSRIPQKELTRVFRKSRKLRREVRRAISKNFPKSSHIHYYVRFIALQRANNVNNICFGRIRRNKFQNHHSRHCLFSRQDKQKINSSNSSDESRRIIYYELLICHKIDCAYQKSKMNLMNWKMTVQISLSRTLLNVTVSDQLQFLRLTNCAWQNLPPTFTETIPIEVK